MDIKISTKQVLTILYVISFIIFIGLCIEAGSFIFNAFFTLVINPDNASYFDLASLYAFDSDYFIVQLLLMSIPAIMKALIFYLIIKILHDKQLNIAQPFNRELGRFITKLSYLALGIGFFSFWGVKYMEWFVKQGVKMPAIETLRLGGADVWLFMGVILLVVAKIFNRGIEIQSENELTV